MNMEYTNARQPILLVIISSDQGTGDSDQEACTSLPGDQFNVHSSIIGQAINDHHLVEAYDEHHGFVTLDAAVNDLCRQA